MASAASLARGIAERERTLTAFLEAEKGAVALACHALALAFARGGTLFAFGEGAAATDAAHVAVEFVHPVIVGKRALPALALANDPTAGSTIGRLGRAGDVALGIAHGASAPRVAFFLDEARALGLLTIALWGPGGPPRADFTFACPSDDEHVVQEVQETLYHVLWELVHVFFEHPGLLDDSGSVSGRGGASTSGLLRRADGARCITCGDLAVEARVVRVADGFAVVEKDGAEERVAVDLVEEGVGVGDVLLCHAGVALERLDPA